MLQKCSKCGNFLTEIDANLYNRVFPEKKMEGCVCESCLTSKRPRWALKTRKQLITRWINHFLPILALIPILLCVSVDKLGLPRDSWFVENYIVIFLPFGWLWLISSIICSRKCIEEFDIKGDEIYESGYHYETTYSYDSSSDTVTGTTEKVTDYAGGDSKYIILLLYCTYLFWTIPVWVVQEIKMLITRKKWFTNRFVRAWRKARGQKGVKVFVGNYLAYKKKLQNYEENKQRILVKYQDSANEGFERITRNNKEKELRKLKRPVLTTSKGNAVSWYAEREKEVVDFVYQKNKGKHKQYFVVKGNLRLYSTKDIYEEEIISVIEKERPLGWKVKNAIQ